MNRCDVEACGDPKQTEFKTGDYTITEVHGADGVQYAFEWNKKPGELVAGIRCPKGWEPTPLARARVIDTLMGMLDGRDLDRVPVGEIFPLVTTIAADIIRQAATARAEAAKYQGEASEAKQKALEATALLHLDVTALARALFELMYRQACVKIELPPAQWPEYLVGVLREEVDRVMSLGGACPKNIPYLVDIIRKVGATWQPK